MTIVVIYKHAQDETRRLYWTGVCASTGLPTWSYDRQAALRQKCGAPDRIVQLVNVYGAGVGERWEYDRRAVTTLVEVRGGRVVRIDDVR